MVRSMLMWLLTVALPLQGISAATMTACGVGHHHRQTGVTLQTAAVSDSDPMPARHVHDHGAASDAHEHAGAAHPDPDKNDLAKGVAHKCSACASCCLNAVVPTEALGFEAPNVTDHFAPPVTRTLAAYVTEGLERPPRPFLA